MHNIVERLGAPQDTISPKINFNLIPPSTKRVRPMLYTFFFFSFLYRVGHPLITLRSFTYFKTLLTDISKYYYSFFEGIHFYINCQINVIQAYTFLAVKQTGEQLVTRIQTRCYNGTCNNTARIGRFPITKNYQ